MPIAAHEIAKLKTDHLDISLEAQGDNAYVIKVHLHPGKRDAYKSSAELFKPLNDYVNELDMLIKSAGKVERWGVGRDIHLEFTPSMPLGREAMKDLFLVSHNVAMEKKPDEPAEEFVEKNKTPLVTAGPVPRMVSLSSDTLATYPLGTSLVRLKKAMSGKYDVIIPSSVKEAEAYRLALINVFETRFPPPTEEKSKKYGTNNDISTGFNAMNHDSELTLTTRPALQPEEMAAAFADMHNEALTAIGMQPVAVPKTGGVEAQRVIKVTTQMPDVATFRKGG